METLKTTPKLTSEEIFKWLSAIPDPEIPVITITELGMVRKIEVISNDEVHVTITPTYSGCPAMDLIGIQIRRAIAGRGIRHVRIHNQLSPAWTTDWMPESAKQKLKDFGIAPPEGKALTAAELFANKVVPCPHCGSKDTQLTSEFGTTACKSLYMCNGCHEPFEYFKCH